MVSIVICTYNRATILPFALDSIFNQEGSTIPFEVLVVDNGSTDNTASIIQNYQKKYPYIKYIYEPYRNLSRARNRGCETAFYNYIAYLDDDGKVRDNFIATVSKIILEFDFDMFGGWFIPWYLTPKPKWLSDKFGSYPCLLKITGYLPDDKDVPGGIMVIKKSVLKECGFFPEKLGMSGDKVSYGEENYVQKKFRKNGKKIGFSPDLILEHLVGEHKYHLSWHLQRCFSKGRDFWILQENISIWIIFITMYRLSVVFFFLIFKKTKNLLFKGDYYIQNYIIDTIGFFYFQIGVLNSLIRKRRFQI